MNINKHRPPGLFFKTFKNITSYSMEKIINYIKASIEEMKKVTWPTKKETYNYTLLVIFISLGVALFLGLLDLIFTKGLELLITNR